MATTTRKRTIPRKQAVGDDLRIVVDEYLQNRSMRERSEFHEGKIKRELLELLEVAGEPVEANKQTLTLEESLPFTQYKNGKPIKKTIVGIERRVRVTKSLSDEATMVLLKEKGLLEECTTTIVVVDEDAIVAANYEGKISDDELAALYTDRMTPAFYLTEE